MAEASTIARPYAKAAFEYALAKGALDDWSGMLALVAQVVSDDELRSRVLDNPKLSSAQKADVVVDVCGEAVNDDLNNFIRLVGQKGRLTALGVIAEQFEALKAQQEKRMEVEILSAFALSEAQEQSLASALAKRLDREISITTQVDPSLLGGVILRAGDTVIDGSVRGRLSRLQDVLSA